MRVVVVVVVLPMIRDQMRSPISARYCCGDGRVSAVPGTTGWEDRLCSGCRVCVCRSLVACNRSSPVVVASLRQGRKRMRCCCSREPRDGSAGYRAVSPCRCLVPKGAWLGVDGLLGGIRAWSCPASRSWVSRGQVVGVVASVWLFRCLFSGCANVMCRRLPSGTRSLVACEGPAATASAVQH